MVLGGMGYAHIIRRSGTGVAVEFESLNPDQVTPDRDKQRRLIYVVKQGNSPSKKFTVERGKPQDILNLRGLGWDGIRGYSVITMARQSIGSAIAMDRYTGGFFAKGGRLPYVLKGPRFVSDAEFDKWRADWEKIYSDPWRAPIMEPQWEYKTIGMNATDAQLLETRQFTVSEICRWFSVSPNLVQDLSRATFSNIENLALQFVKFTMLPWLTRWEQSLWRCVLTPEEQAQGYYFKHDTKALERGDFASRCAGYATMLQNGVWCVDEVRDFEDQNPIDGGEDHHIQLNMQTLPGGTPTAAQQGALVKIGTKPQQ